MSDVSVVEDVEAEDFRLIMNGGQNFLARMNAFAMAKEKAEAIVADANKRATEINAGAVAKMDEAERVLAAARQQRDELLQNTSDRVAQIKAQGEDFLKKAQADAEALRLSARESADIVRQEASAILSRANAEQNALRAKEADLDAKIKKLNKSQEDLDASVKAAEEKAARYEKLRTSLLDAINKVVDAEGQSNGR